LYIRFPLLKNRLLILLFGYALGVVCIVETLHATSLQPFTETHIRRKNESMANISPKHGSLASVIRSYKSAVTRYANKNNIEFRWQTRYHDHIIRNNAEFIRINQYINNNTKKWRDDNLF